MTRICWRSVAVFLVILSFRIEVQAQNTIHVPGTFSTIQSAINAAGTGDIIQLAQGTHLEASISFNGKSVTVRGDENGTTVVGLFLFTGGEGASARLEELSLQNLNDTVISCTNASPTISNCEVSGLTMNSGISSITVLASGGAAVGSPAVSAAPTFLDCRFLNNQSTGAATATVDLMAVSAGGSVSCAATFSNCLFVGNIGGSAGAVRAHAQSPLLATALNTPLFLNCTFRDNTSPLGLAGAVAFSSDGIFANTSATLANCIASGNHGGASGAIALLPVAGSGGVTAKVIHCTFWDNAALTAGNGGMLIASGASMFLWNSILRGSAIELAAAGPPFSQVLVTSCNIEGGYPGNGNIDSSPAWVDSSTGDFHLHANSPCIDGGDPAAPFLPLTDMEGDTRRPDAADIGADEAFLVGTFEDFTQSSLINGAGPADSHEKVIFEGEVLTIEATTPGGSFFGGTPVIAGQFWGPTYTNGVRPSSPGGYPELHVNPFGGFIMKAGGTLGPVPYGFTAAIPSGANLVGVYCRIQSIVVDPGAANLQFAASHTLELSIQ